MLQNLHDQPAPDEPDLWERDWELRTFAWASEQVRARVSESTWLAFWLTAVDGLSGKEAADKLKMSVAGVFVAKSRVMIKLKEQIAAATNDDEPMIADFNPSSPLPNLECAMNACPHPEELLLLVHEKLPKRDHDKLMAHLENCTACQRSL